VDQQLNDNAQQPPEGQPSNVVIQDQPLDGNAEPSNVNLQELERQQALEEHKQPDNAVNVNVVGNIVLGAAGHDPV
jgi:hypothetical protein